MPGRARRLPARPWLPFARRALLMLCLWPPAQLLADAAVICDATYDQPTAAYPHGVLGDRLEWRSLRVTVTQDCSDSAPGVAQRHRIPATADSVFEDVVPRLWDVTGDGKPEIIAVRSHQQQGAQLVIFGLRQAVPVELAATPHIGRRFRWLAPVGAADLDRDGHIEIAYIDRPHLAKTLRIWRFANGALSPVLSVPNLTNHRIGWDFIAGGLRDCGSTPSLVTASGDWARIIETTLRNGVAVRRNIGRYTGPQSLDDAIQCD